jgi:C4-dicarboxylate transporter, DctM subunit
MDLPTIGWLMIAFFLVLMFLNMHIGVALILTGFIGLFIIRGFPGALSAISIIPWRQGINEILLVIPLFTWMGLLAGHAGISKDAFTSLYKLVGRLPGGLAMACTWACAAFGAVCGNQVATSVTLCAVALPEMRKYKYDDGFSLGCIASAGNLGILIPPSGTFVLYGFLTETSISALFISGILPGLLLALLFCVQIYIQCRLNPRLGPEGASFGWKERLFSIKGLWAIVVCFLLVMGGIYFGVFTPNEGAAVGCFVVLMVGLANRQLTWKGFVSSLRESLVVGCMILLIIMGAMLFGVFTTTSEIPNSLSKLINELSLNRYVVLWVILIVYILAGFVMDIFAVLVVTLPIFFPIITTLGFDPIHFGVMCVLCVAIGSITPPFGLNVFAIAGMNRDVPLYTIFKGVMPFVITMIIALIIIVFFPVISTLLPKYMFPYM